MRAAKWDLENGKKRIKGTLEWRREFQPDLIPPEEVRVESESGKMYAPALFYAVCRSSRYPCLTCQHHQRLRQRRPPDPVHAPRA